MGMMTVRRISGIRASNGSDHAGRTSISCCSRRSATKCSLVDGMVAQAPANSPRLPPGRARGRAAHDVERSRSASSRATATRSPGPAANRSSRSGDGRHEQYEPVIDTNVEMISGPPILPPPEGPLESAFPVRKAWLKGELGLESVHPIDLESLNTHFHSIWLRLVEDLDVRDPDDVDRHRREGYLLFLGRRLAPRGIELTAEGVRHQVFRLALRSRALGDATLIRCESPVGLIDLSDNKTVAKLHDLQRDLGHARVCAHRDLRHKSHQVTVEASLLFHPETTQYEEVEVLVREVALQADWIEEVILAHDKDAAHDLWEEPS